MTENEAIEIIKYASAFNLDNSPLTKALEVAITALEEVQQYIAIGTVEELKTAMKYVMLAKKHGTVGKTIDACAEYEEIGTVEECRTAVERMKPKKVRRFKKQDKVFYQCRNCGRDVFTREKYCAICGQAIDCSE